jgi:phosphate transport system substrate-binding protein
MRRKGVAVATALTLSASLLATEPDYLSGLPPYHPEKSVSGTIRVWGNNYIPGLMKKWEGDFQHFEPGVTFETKLPGTEAALAGLYGGIADIVFIGREVYRPERNAFRGRYGYDPLEVQISSGSFATPHKTFSLEVFVHKDNPIAHLTLQQLDAMFGCDLRRGARERIHSWGQLGLPGEWANKPVHVYGYNFDTGMAGYFRLVVLNDSPKWNDQLKDFDNGREPNGEVINAGVYILQALAKDPYGIAYANVLYANPMVKTLALASGAGEPFYAPTRQNVWLRRYPISRFTTLAINRPPGKPIDPKVKEFVRYLLSKEGMAAVAQDGSYLPLTEQLIEQQLRKLE